jgi:hypothetical protein
MLKDRRFQIFARSLFVEMMQLWALARQPAHRIPESIVAQRQREYFHWRLEEALEWLWVDSEPLGEVLEEILLVATGEEEIINWRPPALTETVSRITEPLARLEYTDAAER